MPCLAFPNPVLQGDIELPRRTAEKLLGPTTHAVWVWLFRCTSKEGATHTTRAALSRLSGLSDKQVERALGRLRRAGLLTNDMWTRSRHGRAVMERTVYGRPKGFVYTIPREARTRVESLPRHGGKRTKAGRKGVSQTPATGVSTLHHLIWEVASSGGKYLKKIQKLGKESYAFFPLVSGTPSGDPAGGAPCAPPALVASEGIAQSCSRNGEVPPMDDDNASEAALASEASEASEAASADSGPAGVRPALHGGPADVRRPRAASPHASAVPGLPEIVATPRGSRGVMAYEEWASNQPVPLSPSLFVAVCHEPKAPRVQPGWSDAERAVYLARMYREGVRANGQESWAFARGNIRRSKHYRLLVKAAGILERNEVAPCDWIGWSVHQWSRYHPERGPAPVTWVFSANRLGERMDWFRHDWEPLGGMTSWGREHRALLGDHARMGLLLAQTAMRRRRNLTPEEIGALVVSVFPPGAYAARLERAQAESRRAQDILDARLAMGEWVWS